MHSTTDNDEILNLIVESAVDVMDAKACSLFLTKSRGNTEGLFHPVAQVGLSDNYIHSPAAKAQKTTAILEKDGYLAAEDATTDPRVQNHAAKKAEGIASILVVPVRAYGKTIGILALYTAETKVFSPDEISYLSALADQGGIAIARARDEYKQKRNHKFYTNITETLSSSLDIQAVLHVMTSEIADAFELHGVTVRLLDEDKQELKLVASYGLSEKYLNKGPISADRIHKVLKHRFELIEDINTNDVDYFEERKAEGIVTMLHLPISVKDDVIGLLGIYSDEKRWVEEEDVELVSAIAKQCGLAIQNASLFLQAKQEKKDLEQEIWAHKAWF